MNRRTFLGLGGATALGTVAGCLGGDDGYETTNTNGVEVPLAPIDDVYEWYENDEANFADARGRNQYERGHIAGAVFSPAPDGAEDDPAEEWSTDTQIVTYCGCPHHLSSMRAASLIDDGYEEVYALDEGFQAWIDNGYPLEGSAVSEERATYEIEGQSDASYAGEMVMLEQIDADRNEAAPIAEDGSYTLQLHYAGSTESPFRVEAPDYTVEGTLAELTSTVITP